MTSAVVGYKGIYKRRWIQNVEWVFCDCLIKMIEEATLFKFHSTCHRAFMVYQILFYSNWWPIPVSFGSDKAIKIKIHFPFTFPWYIEQSKSSQTVWRRDCMSPWGPSLQANFYCKSQQRATVCEIIKEAVCNNKKFQILSGHLPPRQIVTTMEMSSSGF